MFVEYGYWDFLFSVKDKVGIYIVYRVLFLMRNVVVKLYID